MCTGELGRDYKIVIKEEDTMQNKNKIKNFLILLLVCTLFSSNILFVSAEDTVKITDKEYEVYFAGSGYNMLCNKKSIGNEVGTEYFLTYTVEDVESSGKQNGLIGTSAPELQHPYSEEHGVLYMHYTSEKDQVGPLLHKGYTYLIKYVVTETGFRYTAAKAKDGESEYVVLASRHADETLKENCVYFGLWFGVGDTNAHLTHVRFYDKNGNDLGVQSPRMEAVVTTAGNTAKAKDVEASYILRAKNLSDLAISNELPLTTSKMYIEYTVKSNSSTCSQTGVAYSNEPKEKTPHANGVLRYSSSKETPDDFLLQVGAEYLITLERNSSHFVAIVQITKNGRTEKLFFPNVYGKGYEGAQYFSLWFGDATNKLSNFILENVKFYDENHKNLGVQSNNDGLSIRYVGPMLDYTNCEAVYYCKADKSLYVLNKDQSMQYVEDKDILSGSYSISKNVITLKTARDTQKYDYLYRQFSNDEGKLYERLYTYDVKFVSGTGEEVETQRLDMSTGYIVQKPKDPVLKDCTFKGWCMADGTEYDFESIVTESKTLYAKWSDGAGVEYIADGDGIRRMDTTPYLVIGGCAILFLVTIGVSVLILKRGGQKRVSRKSKEKKN